MAQSNSHALLLLEDRGLRAYAESILGAADRVDDVLQNVAEKLLRDPPAVKEPRRFLVSAVRNAAIDEYRVAERRSQREADYAATRAETSLLEDRVYVERLLVHLDGAIRELPLLTQSLFVGYYVHGYSQQALATGRGLHLSTVEKRLAKARRHCHRRLARFR